MLLHCFLMLVITLTSFTGERQKPMKTKGPTAYAQALTPYYEVPLAEGESKSVSSLLVKNVSIRDGLMDALKLKAWSAANVILKRNPEVLCPEGGDQGLLLLVVQQKPIDSDVIRFVMQAEKAIDWQQGDENSLKRRYKALERAIACEDVELTKLLLEEGAPVVKFEGDDLLWQLVNSCSSHRTPTEQAKHGTSRFCELPSCFSPRYTVPDEGSAFVIAKMLIDYGVPIKPTLKSKLSISKCQGVLCAFLRSQVAQIDDHKSRGAPDNQEGSSYITLTPEGEHVYLPDEDEIR